MKSFFAALCGMLALLSAAVADDMSVSPDAWHDPEAPYRLEASPEPGTKPSFLDERKLLLPADFSNGVRVFDSEGARISIHQYDNGGVWIPATPVRTTLFFYFGYEQKKEFEHRDGVPANVPLYLFQSDARIELLPEQWRSGEIRRCEDQIKRWVRGSKCPEYCNHNLKECTLVRDQYRRCKNALFDFCGRSVVARGFNAKTNLYLDPPPYLTCCKLFPYRPDYQDCAKDHSICKKWNNARQIHRYYYFLKEKNERMNAVTADPSGTLETSLLASFDKHPRQLETGQIFLPKRPFDTGQRFAVMYKGNLRVDATAEYEFKIRSNASRILRLDGKTVFRELGETPNTEIIGTDSLFRIKLERGLHPLEMIYHKDKVITWFSASWRKTGDPDFATLDEDDFSPAVPLEPSAMFSKEGANYPLMRVKTKYSLYTDKHRHYDLYTFAPLSDMPSGYRWALNDVEFPQELNTFAAPGARHAYLPPDETPVDPMRITITPAGPVAFTPLRAVIPSHARSNVPVSPDVSMTLWTPWFLFDDEVLDFTVELRSRMPFPLHAELLMSTLDGKKDSVTVKPVYISALRPEHMDRFASDHLYKTPLKVNGAVFRHKPATAEFAVRMPGLEFDRKSIRVSGPANLTSFTFSPDGFRDAEGGRIVPLLHRPGLHELRKWQLPLILTREFRKTSKVLVIAEDFGSFLPGLTKAFAERGIEMEAVSWIRSQNGTGNDSLQSLPRIFETIRSSKADTVVLVPMNQARRTLIPLREELRALSFVIQAVRECSSASSCFLVPPLPSNPKLEDDRTRMIPGLRELKRQYGISFLELDAEMQRLTPAEVFTVSCTEESVFPAGAAQPLANLIANTVINHLVLPPSK